mmetsp:Transcript_13851/g.30456  ORF Transcript_13851/g.30456 Transcript_13851/m.30456 type:complete len:277 (-) Transcript_13851:163-993(-)|eukprot:CAMPEP_0170608958 /NCGR_PEP_ID=MMETSP0224-20130122/21865_1 /TAXON_ID=285029 /ORGANISM="Togula jolla, Strain CCCM 725" /LENGTH=276 /DNA_ID=CAMNT_0010934225 /DNA_START=121 /DNA_END=951 /DNA_ORIENTATION=+
MLDVEAQALPKAKAKAKGKANAKAKAKAKAKAQPDIEASDEDVPINEARLLSKNLAREIRMGFVQKVYCVLSLQLMGTAAVALPIASASREWLAEYSWLAALGTIAMLVCIIAFMCFRSFVRRHPWPFLMLITAAKGILLGFLTARYTWQSAALAAGITSVVFVTMTIYAWTTRTDFTGYAPYFHSALMVFIVFGLTLMIMRWCGIYISWLTMIFDLFGVLLFTAYIIFDTQRILGEWGGHKTQFSVDDWAFAALALYRDIVQLYRHLLRLTGTRR